MNHHGKTNKSRKVPRRLKDEDSTDPTCFLANGDPWDERPFFLNVATHLPKANLKPSRYTEGDKGTDTDTKTSNKCRELHKKYRFRHSLPGHSDKTVFLTF